MANQHSMDSEGFLPVSRRHSFRPRRGSSSPFEAAGPASESRYQLRRDLDRNESTDMEVEKIPEVSPSPNMLPDALQLQPIDNPFHISDMTPDEEMIPVKDPGANCTQISASSDNPDSPTLMQTILEALPRLEPQHPTSPAVTAHGSPQYRRSESIRIMRKVDGVPKEYTIGFSLENEQTLPSGSRYFIDLEHNFDEMREQQILADLAYLENGPTSEAEMEIFQDAQPQSLSSSPSSPARH